MYYGLMKNCDYGTHEVFLQKAHTLTTWSIDGDATKKQMHHKDTNFISILIPPISS